MIEERAGPHVRDLGQLASTLLAAYLRANVIAPADLPEALRILFVAFSELAHSPMAKGPTPAVPIQKSVARNYIVCLEDGRKVKLLKRHLRIRHGLTPDEYRTKWGVPPHYPMVAPAYTLQRSRIAKEAGLGRKPELQARVRT